MTWGTVIALADVAVITGAGRGIGAATARLLASTRPDVVQVLSFVTNRDAAERVAGEVTAHGGSAHVVRADVAVEADVIALFQSAEEHGTVRHLVNNAGVLFTAARVDEFDVERITRTMAVNVIGSLLCAREAITRMSTRHGGNGGSIVNLSSRASSLGSPHEFVDYAASKGAVDTMTVGLAAEVATEGIRVNAVRPGLIDTDIHVSSGIPDRVARLAEAIPMARGGTADEVAAAIVWLLSDQASYVTGALLDVGGGR